MVAFVARWPQISVSMFIDDFGATMIHKNPNHISLTLGEAALDLKEVIETELNCSLSVKMRLSGILRQFPSKPLDLWSPWPLSPLSYA